MERHEFLTNESVSKKFNNMFDLVNYSIGLATQLIKTGRAPRTRVDSDNPAVIIIEELQDGKDLWEDLKEEEPVVQFTETIVVQEKKPAASQPTEKKRARRLIV